MIFTVSKLLLLVIALSVDALLIISLLIGNIGKAYIPSSLTTVLSFTLLFILGTVKLFDSSIKKYARPKKADTVDVEVLSPKAALSLGLALALDSMAAGLGTASCDYPLLPTALLIFSIGIGAISCGCLLGRKLSAKSDFNFSFYQAPSYLLLTKAHEPPTALPITPQDFPTLLQSAGSFQTMIQNKEFPLLTPVN